MVKVAGWVTFLLVFGFFLCGCRQIVKKSERLPEMTPNLIEENQIKLPEPRKAGEVSLEEAIQKRRSRRDFTDQPLTLKQISQILWAAQGITDESTGFRTAPSAGALYPLELYLVVKDEGVEGLVGGVYHYQTEDHSLQIYLEEDVQKDFAEACLSQSAVFQAPVSLVITAEYERTTGKYGEKGKRYVEIEAGHVGQNVYLQVEALGLGTCAIGAFDDGEVSKILNLPATQKPLYVMPIGHPKS